MLTNTPEDKKTNIVCISQRTLVSMTLVIIHDLKQYILNTS